MRRTLLLCILLIAGALAAEIVDSRPPKPEEKRLLVTADSLIAWGITDIDPKPQTFRTTYNTVNHAFRVIGLYDKSTARRLHLTSSAEIFSTATEAEKTFPAWKRGTKTGVARVAGVTLQDADALLTMGDQHYAGLMKVNGEKRGNVFLFRQGRVLHSLIVSGIYFERHREVRKLFEPVYNESVRQFHN
jgi:hypothetical protein